MDGTTARLRLPLVGEDEALAFHFGPATGLLASVTAMRRHGASGPRVPWTGRVDGWGEIEGLRVPAAVSAA